MRKLGFLSAMFVIMISTSLSHAQWPIGSNATVVSGFQFGPNYFYYLQNAWGTYKTAAMPDPLLTVSQTVYLMPTGEEGTFTIPGLTLEYEVAAYTVDDGYMQNGEPEIPESILPYYREDYDILVFSDSLHVDTNQMYMDYLENLFHHFEMDDIIEAYHSNFPGFQSYYAEYNAAWGDDDDEETIYTEEQIDALNQEWFIFDEVDQAIFNRNRLIGVGKKVVLWYSFDMIISTSDDDNEAIEMLIELSNDSSLLNSILYNPRFELESNGIYEFETTHSNRMAVFVTSYMRYIETLPRIKNVACNNRLKTLELPIQRSIELTPNANGQVPSAASLREQHNKFSNIDYSDFVVDVIVNWGDGITEEFSNFQGQALSHLYPEGTYTYQLAITTKVYINEVEEQITLYDGVGTERKVEAKVQNINCSTLPYDNAVYAENSQYKVHCIHSFYGPGKFRLGANIKAKSRVYKKTGSNGSNMVKTKVKLASGVDAKLFYECGGSPVPKVGSNVIKKRHHRTKRKTKLWRGRYYGIDEILKTFTRHMISGEGSNNMQFNFYMDPC